MRISKAMDKRPVFDNYFNIKNQKGFFGIETIIYETLAIN